MFDVILRNHFYFIVGRYDNSKTCTNMYAHASSYCDNYNLIIPSIIYAI